MRYSVRRDGGEVRRIDATWLCSANAESIRTLTTMVRRLFGARLVYVRFVEYVPGTYYAVATTDRDDQSRIMATHSADGYQASLYRVDRKTGRWDMLETTDDVYTLTCQEPDPVLSSPY